MTWSVVGRTCSDLPSSGGGLGSSLVVGEFSRCVTEVFHFDTSDWCCWGHSYTPWVRRRLPNVPLGECVAQTGSSRKEAPKSPSWEGAEQEIHLPQNFHTFLICSLETTFRVMLSSPNLPVISVSRGWDSHSGSGLSSQGLAPSLPPFWAGVGLVTNGCNQSTCLDFSTQSWFVNGVFC